MPTALKPFANNSLWNSRPTTVTLGTELVPTSLYSSLVAAGDLSPARYVSDPSDSLVTVVGPVGGSGIYIADAEVFASGVTLRLPVGIVPPAGGDGHVDIIDIANNRIHSFYQFKDVSGTWRSAQYSWSAFDGSGFGTPGQYFQGSRATGVVPIAGTILTGELSDGNPDFGHALSMSMAQEVLGRTPTYVFPVTSADASSPTTHTGQFPEGSFMMLPASFDESSITQATLLKVVKTLKKWGAYVVDENTGCPFIFYVEHGSGFDLFPSGPDLGIYAQLDTIRQGLRRVMSASGWLDSTGTPFVPVSRLNLLSLRGSWFIATGQADIHIGVFDSYTQTLNFPGTSGSAIIQIASTGRSMPPSAWAAPVPGETFLYSVTATGGAKLQLQVINASYVGILDAGVLANGESFSFVWPVGGMTVALFAVSSSTGGGSVSGTLVKTADVPVPTGTSSGNFSFTMRFVSGKYTGGGAFENASRSRKKTLFPRRDVPAVDLKTGILTEPWYRVLQDMYERKLGGDLAPSIGDIQDNVLAAVDAVSTTTAAIAAVTQVVENNAASQAASIEVAQNAGDPGADQIPPPILTVPDVPFFQIEGGGGGGGGD